jgi:hypothetical protein
MAPLDITKLKLYYISFNKLPSLETELRSLGFVDVNLFEAIDGRKLDPFQLKEDGVISIRSFNELFTGDRREVGGMPSMGAIGCALSHGALLKKCVDENLDYIIVAESDVKLHYAPTQKTFNDIGKLMERPNTVVIGQYPGHYPYFTFKKSDIPNRKPTFFFGAHFVILSRGACEKLLEDFFPIDVQYDAYIAHMDTIGRVNAEPYNIASQKVHLSSIQDFNIGCLFSQGVLHWGTLAVILVLIIICITLGMRCRFYKSTAK